MQLSRHWRDVHEAAQRALTVGDGEGCRDASMRMMRRARQAGDIEAQAHASLLLARSQWVCSLPDNAMHWAVSAERLGRQAEDETVVAAALSVQSCAASALGQTDVALDCARISLCELSSSIREEAIAANYLATALSWAGRFDESRRAFDTCLVRADECADRELSFQPLVNRCLSVLLQLGAGGLYRQRGRSVDLELALERLHRDLEACEDMLQHGQISTVNAGMERIMELCYLCLRGQLMLLCMQLDAADACLRQCRERSLYFPRQHWVQLFVHWLAFEHAHRRRQPRCAAVSAKAMELAAWRGGHEAFREFALGLQDGSPVAAS